MSSPLVPSPFMYGDLPQGGVLAPIVISARAPSNTTDKQYAAGYFWLSSLDQYQIISGVPTYGNGNLYYQAGNSSGTPNWVLVSDSSGPIVGLLGTANQITATNSSGTVTLSTPATFIAPGSIAATTSITATLGNITATNGNFVLGAAPNKQVYTSLANTATALTNAAGTVALVGGTIVVTTTAVSATSQIRLTCQALGTVVVPSALCVSAKSTGVSFTILASQVTDTSTIFWEIVN